MGNAQEYYFNRVACFIQDAYVGLHHKWVSDDGDVKIPGNACQNTRTLMNQAQYWCHDRRVDVWFSMGAQKEHLGFKSHKHRLPDALRKTHNTIAAKCFYIDVDVDLDPKKDAYRTVEEMDAEIDRFVDNSGLPPPNLTVNSGRGGRHLYWILDQPIHPDDFNPVARALANAAIALGLKCDSACTSDICRLLRPPGTLNYKDPKKPLPVTIHSRIEEDYTYEVIAGPLANYIKTNGTNATNARPKHGLGPGDASPDYDDPDNEDADNIEGGIADKTYELADIDLVGGQCPFVKDALATGGADHREPLWHISLALACHTTDPEDAAKRLSFKHPDYDEGKLLKKLAEAQRARHDNPSLGPPKCEAIAIRGSKFCGACPHLHSNTTPIFFGVPQFNSAANAAPAGNGGRRAKDQDLPAGYYRGPNDFIYMNTPDSKTLCVLRHKIVRNSGYFEGMFPWHFVFHTEQSGVEKPIRFSYADAMDKLTLAKFLASYGVNIKLHEESYKFMTNFLQHLRSLDKKVVDIPALGWHARNGAVGFSFDTRFVSSQEDIKCHRLPPDQGKYGGFGSDEPWKDLAGIVLSPDRPDLALLVASGFAAPLLHFTGHSGVILGGWSLRSGIAKTTSLSLSQAIWGCPSNMSGLDDTLNFVMAKASMLKCLPLFYDEIKTVEQVKNLATLIHNLTRGVEKGRLNIKGEMKPTRTWETQITYAANASMTNAVAELQKGTLAGLYRMFEFECLTNRPTIHSSGTIARMTKALYSNYGVIGRQYAEYLGRNHDDVQKFVIAEHEKYSAHFNALQEERYWTSLMATLMAGAQFANHMGIAVFPIDEMEEFLFAEFIRMRGDQSKSTADYSNPETVMGELSNVLNHYRAKNTVVTDVMILNAGKPGKNAVNVLNDKMIDIKKETIYVHIGLSPLMVRISMQGLGQWAKLNNVPIGSLNAGLQQMLGAKATTAKLASGTEYATMAMGCWQIPIGGTPVEQAVEWATQFKI